MDITLARIDDRFIHGQVTVGWSQKLRPDHILLANDEIAADTWQSRVYSSSVPPEITVSILGLEATCHMLQADAAQFTHSRTILLTGSTADMLYLFEKGRMLGAVNVGGMHYSTGKQELLPFVYVDQDDLTIFRRLLAAGCELTAQQVPGGRAVQLNDNLIASMEGRL